MKPHKTRNRVLFPPKPPTHLSRIVAEHALALKNADRHKQHLEDVTTDLMKEDIKEAESLCLTQLESLRQELLEERLTELRECQEGKLTHPPTHPPNSSRFGRSS